eukprot:scaffold2740_cov122-Skeletonema_marinoi.AAC.3
MRVFLPAALQNQQQQQQQQHQVYSPSTSSVETALVCNKSNNKKKPHHQEEDDEGDDFSLSHSHEQDCTLDIVADTTADTVTKETAIGNESEAKRPVALLAPPPSNNHKFSNNDNDDLDDRKIAAKKEGEEECYLVQPKLKKARVQHNNLEQRFIPSLKSCQEEGDDDWKQSNQFAAAVAASSTTKAVHNNNIITMGGGGKLISGPPPSNATSSLRQASNNSNVVGVAAAASIGGRGGLERNQQPQQQQMMMVGPSVAAAAASSYHQRRRGEERVASATAAAPNVASAASFPQPHDDDNEVGDEWNDNNNSSSGKQHASSASSSSTIFINPPNNNNNNNSSRRGGYKTSSSPRSSTSSAAAAASALATNTAPLLNRPIPGSIDDPATMSKSDILFLPSSSTTSDGGGEGSIVYEDPILNQFVQVLRTHKPPLEMVEMEGDGNCLFRAISLQVYGDQGMHAEVRKNCLDFMQKDTSHFQDFVADEPFHQYIARKRLIGVHGNHTEIQAMSELYNRSIEVFVPPKGITPINIFHEEYYKNNDADPPIRLCYMDGNHYNAIIDPLVPTAGLGLGLPGLQPGLADKLQMEQAKHASNESALDEKMQLALKESNRAQKEREEREMKEVLTKSALSMDDAYQKKALYLSEIEAADFDLEQAVLASSMESYRNAEQERKPSSRRLDSRRNRFNSSPRGQRSSSSSPIHRSNSPIAAASSASSTSQFAAVAAAAAASSTVASYSRSSPPNVASAASIGGGAGGGIASSSSDEYPASVQELVMNDIILRRGIV